MRQKRSFDSERGGFIRATRGEHRHQDDQGSRRYEEPFEKVPEVAPFHVARNMITRARLGEEVEGELIAMITGAGTVEIQRLLDSGELQTQIKEFLN